MKAITFLCLFLSGCVSVMYAPPWPEIQQEDAEALVNMTVYPETAATESVYPVKVCVHSEGWAFTWKVTKHGTNYVFKPLEAKPVN